jgi:hypothetical protein
LQRFFQTCAFDESDKQLEICAAYFDIFRSQNGLLVVPGSMSVYFPSSWCQDGRALYQNLVYPPNLKLDGRALFETSQAIYRKKTNEIVLLGKKIEVGFYYHPACAIHPWVDRAFVALDNAGGQCVVLCQDKINDDLPKAVAGLNSAAKLMHAAGWKRILCVAHVVDASDQTKAQNKFEYPYLLIQSDQLNDYYSLHFAPAIMFVRARHQLGLNL